MEKTSPDPQNKWVKVSEQGGEKSASESLRKTFTFRDFKQALEFVNKVGKVAEELQHHPDICIQNYNEVMLSTTTHHAQNILTEKDYELAARVDAMK